MTNDNREMWTELGIDLKPHDTLLNALGPIFQEVYLSQKTAQPVWAFLTSSLVTSTASGYEN